MEFNKHTKRQQILEKERRQLSEKLLILVFKKCLFFSRVTTDLDWQTHTHTQFLLWLHPSRAKMMDGVHVLTPGGYRRREKSSIQRQRHNTLNTQTSKSSGTDARTFSYSSPKLLPFFAHMSFTIRFNKLLTAQTWHKRFDTDRWIPPVHKDVQGEVVGRFHSQICHQRIKKRRVY